MKRTYSRSVKKGFTLIELAVVMAIVAILAAVALPRMGDMRATSQASLLRDFKSKLQSAASMFTAEQGRMPNGFEFLQTNTNAPTSPATISFRGINSAVNGITCTGGGTGALTFTCAGGGGTSNVGTVTYTYNAGSVSAQITTAGTNAPTSLAVNTEL